MTNGRYNIHLKCKGETMQERYWNQLTQYKYDILYLSERFANFIVIDRVIKIVIAVSSSTAIGSWIIWEKFSYLWASLIATSQVFNVINDYLPYKKRISELSAMISKLISLYTNIEHDWYKVANSYLTNDEINELLYTYMRQWNDINDKYFEIDALSLSEKCLNTAEEEKNKYFNNFLGGTHEQQTKQNTETNIELT